MADTIVIKCSHQETKCLVRGYQSYKSSLALGVDPLPFPAWVLSSAICGSLEDQVISQKLKSVQSN